MLGKQALQFGVFAEVNVTDVCLGNIKMDKFWVFADIKRADRSHFQRKRSQVRAARWVGIFQSKIMVAVKRHQRGIVAQIE